LRLAWTCLLLATAAAAQDFSVAKKQPDPQVPAMQAANEALEAQDWEQAVKLLTTLAETNPKDAKILYDLGSAEDALDHTSAAEKAYRAAIADDEKLEEAHIALGLLLARNGKLDEGRTELAAGAAINGDITLTARALRALARIDQKQRPAEARDELLAALSITPETPDDKLMAAELAEAAGNGRSAAEAEYRKVLAAQPNNPPATAALAHLLAQDKQFAEAEILLTSALTAHPDDEGLNIQLASTYAAEGKTGSAVPIVETLHTANPSESNVTRLLAELYSDQKSYEKAEPLLAGLCAQNPKDGELTDLRAAGLMHLHRSAEAETILKLVVAEPTDFPTPEQWTQAAADLAFAASENNEPAVVLQILSERAKVLPPSAPILFLSAISEDKLHQTKLAAQAYKDFLAASNGALPDEEFEARHRLVALEHAK
jgi:predicted Zn-dependent protease